MLLVRQPRACPERCIDCFFLARLSDMCARTGIYIYVFVRNRSCNGIYEYGPASEEHLSKHQLFWVDLISCLSEIWIMLVWSYLIALDKAELAVMVLASIIFFFSRDYWICFFIDQSLRSILTALNVLILLPGILRAQSRLVSQSKLLFPP